ADRYFLLLPMLFLLLFCFSFYIPFLSLVLKTSIVSFLLVFPLYKYPKYESISARKSKGIPRGNEIPPYLSDRKLRRYFLFDHIFRMKFLLYNFNKSLTLISSKLLIVISACVSGSLTSTPTAYIPAPLIPSTPACESSKPM